MPEGSPRHNLLTEPLHGALSVYGIQKENMAGNPRQLSSAGRWLRIPL